MSQAALEPQKDVHMRRRLNDVESDKDFSTLMIRSSARHERSSKQGAPTVTAWWLSHAAHAFTRASARRDGGAREREQTCSEERRAKSKRSCLQR